MRTAIPLALVLLFAAACAPKMAPASVAGTPRFPDFVAPIVPPFSNASAAAHQDRGWAFLQMGDLDQADREFTSALKGQPAFYPAEISLGYLELARKHPGAALTRFARALDAHRGDASALVGRGQAQLALGRERDALAAFQAAAAADPSLLDLTRQIDVLKFRLLEANLAKARAAARAGRFDDAIQAYLAAIADSPDSPILYRELAGVEHEKGDSESALENLRTAVWLDPGDAKSFAEIGRLLEERHDLEGATKAYRQALAIEPSAEVEARLEAMSTRGESGRLPAEYRAIDGAPQIARGDLAALIGVGLAPLLEVDPRRSEVPITDVSSHWASAWIMLVTHAGMMEPFANHTFQPRAVVRRADFALVVRRVLARITELKRGQEAWETAKLKFSDLPPGHLAYRAASAAVAAGVMRLQADGSFQPSRVVTGAEAVEAIGRLQTLAGIPTGQGGRR
jgi:tetratricopeptide (TPR) repeat protein